MTNFLRKIKIMCYLDKIISQKYVISEALCVLALISSLWNVALEAYTKLTPSFSYKLKFYFELILNFN